VVVDGPFESVHVPYPAALERPVSVHKAIA
jgi:hypothetical protein